MKGKKLSTNHRLLMTICILVAASFVVVTNCIFYKVYSAQPTPYIDEIFHIPQATKYYNGLFSEWDSKITTLPGLYLLSIGVLKPYSWLLGRDICGVYTLRFTNVGACFVNYYLFLAIQTKIQQPRKDLQTLVFDLISVINMASFPVSYFFTFLYYTDTVSLMLILLTYLLHLERCNLLAATTGLLSVLVRQTNIIWVVFFALLTMTQALKREIIAHKRKVTPHLQRNLRYLQVLAACLHHAWRGGVTSRINFTFRIFQQLWGYSFVVGMFLIFVFLNGGIVVGDKSAHEAMIHIPQLLYFSLFTTFFCLPYFIPHIVPFIKFSLGHKKLLLSVFIAGCAIIGMNTLVHPYLLADNRHFSFYIWKRLYEKHFIIKYLLLPVYFFGIFSMIHILKHSGIVFLLGYVMSVSLCLVPHRLMEFRYFIIPYLLFRLQIKHKHFWQLIFEFCLYGCVNAATVYLFLTRVFYWTDSEDPQRLMW